MRGDGEYFQQLKVLRPLIFLVRHGSYSPSYESALRCVMTGVRYFMARAGPSRA